MNRHIIAHGTIYQVDGHDADGRQIVKTARSYGEWNGDTVYLVEGEEILFDGFGLPVNVIASARHWPEVRDYVKRGK